MEQETDKDVALLGKSLGPAPFIVEVGQKRTLAILAAIPKATMLCFDSHLETDKLLSDRIRVRFIHAYIWHRTGAFEFGKKLVQARSLDHFWEEYQFPIDLLVCNSPAYPNVILGGRRIIFESRLVAIARQPEESQTAILDAMLPDHKRMPDADEYLIYKNETL